jgi:2-oxoisovalerate dehydrogenase E1 component
VMGRRMEEDPRIVCMGEDIHKLNGGPRGATKGLAQRFPDRTLGTPISEAAFTGLGGGLALDGRYIPVVELMYADFIWVAADQLFNQIGKARHMFGGEHPMRLVMRVKVGTKTGYGSQHSMDPSGIMATSVGWRIAAPSTAIDYIGMMNSALLVNDPVVVLEHDADLYNQVVQVPDGELDFYTPIGKAAVRRSGSEATVLTYMSMVSRSLQAVENLGRDVEVIDLRWLDRGSIDWDTIGESIRKTNRVVIVEQGSLGTSYGGWLADEIQRRFFDYLDAPVSRVHGSESSPTISKALETAALADIPEIEKGLTDLLSGVHGGRA